MRQIARLRAGAPSAAADVELVSELRALRQRRGELETHLSTLQDSRRQLMGQLDSLMKMLKVSERDLEGWVGEKSGFPDTGEVSQSVTRWPSRSVLHCCLEYHSNCTICIS